MMRKILGFITLTMFSMLLWLIAMTPEKTKYNEYTQPFKYWTDNVYYNDNFIGQ